MKNIFKLIILTLSLSLSLSHLFAQEAPFSGSKNQKANYYFGEALKTYQGYDYPKTQNWLDKAVNSDPNFIEAYLMMAEMKMNDEKYEEAIKLFDKVSTLNPEFPRIYSGKSKAYFRLKKYDEALQNAEKFLSYPDYYGKKAELTIIKNNAEFAKAAVLAPVPFKPVNMGPSINSSYHDYFPGLTADEQTFIFTRLDLGRNEEFYISHKINDQWELAQNMGTPVNTEGNEGTISLSADGQYIFYTACKREDGLGSCDLYISKLDGNSWSVPRNLGAPVNTNAWETQPALTYDGKTVYFTSNRAGGFGKSDIWYTTFKNGKWSPPINLGPEINTTEDEQSPFIAKDDQTLYFVSDGHPGMGGLDIFISKKSKDGRWEKPKNMGYPINSDKSENSFVIASNGKDAFIAKEGDDTYGGLDLYTFELYEEARPQKTGYAKGVVFDAVTRKKITAKIELIDLASGKVVVESYSNKITGEFLVCLQGNKNYMLNVANQGYMFYSENFALKNQSAIEPLVLSIPLQPLANNVTMVLKNVFFDSEKFELKPESKAELDKVVQLLNANPNIKIEIGGHTDNTGDNKKNTVLSTNRAKAVIGYLTTNGIIITRLTHKGYADTKPVADNKTEAGRAQNRRTEIKIVQ